MLNLTVFFFFLQADTWLLSARPYGQQPGPCSVPASASPALLPRSEGLYLPSGPFPVCFHTALGGFSLSNWLLMVLQSAVTSLSIHVNRCALLCVSVYTVFRCVSVYVGVPVSLLGRPQAAMAAHPSVSPSTSQQEPRDCRHEHLAFSVGSGD